MAFKISAKDQKRIEALFAKFTAQAADVEFAKDSFNEAVNEARGNLDDELAALNEIRDEIRGVFEDLHSEMDSEYDDKSDNWKDGDRGSATQTWIEKLDEIKTAFEDEIEIDTPEAAFEPDELEVNQYLDDLPVEPEY